MRLTCLLAVFLLYALCITQVMGSCNICGALSEDYCTCRGLRPNPKILIGPQAFIATTHPTGNCQCGKHLVEPIITEPHTIFKSIPIFYTTPLCPGCAAIGAPACNRCITNCKPLCNKCGLIGKPICSACVASVGVPTVSAYSLTDEWDNDFLNSIPQKISSNAYELSQQASSPVAKYSSPNGASRNVVEMNETKLNATTAQLLGLKKYFSYKNSNNDNDRKSSSMSSQSSNEINKKNMDKRVMDDDNEEENPNNSDEPQAFYVTYNGVRLLPDMTKMMTIPSLNDQYKIGITSTQTSSSSSSLPTSSSNDYQSGRLMELFRLSSN